MKPFRYALNAVYGFMLLNFIHSAQAQIKVACIGNSITAGYGLTGNALPYPARLQQLLGNGYTVENEGVSGTTMMKQGDNPYWATSVGKMARLFAFKPDVVTIFLGTNDTKAQNWDVRRGDFKRDYLAMIDTLNTLSTKPRIFLGMPPPIWNNSFGIRDSALVKMMVIIREIAWERGLPTIDCYAPLKPFQTYFSDGVHPNGAGADSIAHILHRSLSGSPSIRFQNKTFGPLATSLPYRFFMPEKYSPSQKYPLIVSLHGAGERGTDNLAQITSHRLAEIWAEDSTQAKQQSFVLAPQCQANEQWVDVPSWDQVFYSTSKIPFSNSLNRVVKLVDSLLGILPIDSNRIYVTGLSMGGYGTWDLISRYPNKFAAAIPISGGVDTSQANGLKEMPIWSIHGALDKVVPPTATRSLLQKFKGQSVSVVEYKTGYSNYFSNPTLTRTALQTAIDGGAQKIFAEYTDGEHDIWSRSYNDPLLARWLFKQVKQVPVAITNPSPKGKLEFQSRIRHS